MILYGDSRRGERFLPYSGALSRPVDAFEDELASVAAHTDGLVREMESWLRRTHKIRESLAVLNQISPHLARTLRSREEEGGEVNPY